MAESVGDQGGARPAGAPTGAADPLERRAAAIEARVRQLMAAQARGRRQLVLVALLVVGMFVVFTFATTRRVKQNLQEDRLRAAVLQRVPDVRPDFERHLTAVARDVMPVYREQAVTRFREVGPEVADLAIQRLKTLPETSAKQLEGHLRTSHDRVLARLAPEITARYPSLTDEQKKAVLATYFHDQIEGENAKLATKINAMHTNEAIRVQAVLEKFDVGPDEPPAAPGERERQFLHALVDVLIDSQMTGYGPAAPPAVMPQTQPQLAADAAAASDGGTTPPRQ